MFDWQELTLFLFINARVGGFVLFNPLLGRNNIPAAFRGGMALVLSWFVMGVTTQRVDIPGTLPELGLTLMLELGLGFLLGMAVNFFFYIPQLAGDMVDTQMGMTMNQMYDPGTSSNMSVTGQILNVLMTLLFFAAGGHYTLLRIFLTSEEIVPLGTAALRLPAVQYLLELFIGSEAVYAHPGGGAHRPGGHGGADEGDPPDQCVRHQHRAEGDRGPGPAVHPDHPLQRVPD